MVYYNISQLANIEAVSELAVYANTVTDNLFFGFVIIGLFFIMLFILKRWEFDKALLSSSFACFILSIILVYGGFLSIMFALVFLIIFAFTGFYMYIQSR